VAAGKRYKRFAGHSVNNASYHNENWDRFHGGNELRDVAFDSLADALADIGTATKTLYVTTQHRIARSTIIPANVTLIPLVPRCIALGNGVTLTINSPFPDVDFQVFTRTGTGTVLFGPDSTPCPSSRWFGSASLTDSTSAINWAISVVVASASNFVRKLRIPAGYHYISGRLALDRNSISICGDGQQATFLAFRVETTLSFASTGFTGFVNGDVTKTIRSTTVMLRMSSAGYTTSTSTDIGKEVQNGTGGTGILVRRDNSGVRPFWEIRVTAGSFANGNSVSIPTGTGAGTVDAAPETITNEGTITAIDNTARTCRVQMTAGYFWAHASAAVVSGIGGGTLSADAVDDADSCIAISPDGSGDRHEYCKITDIGFDCVYKSKSVAIDISNSPNTTIRDCYATGFWDGLQGGDCWNSKLDGFTSILNRHHAISLPANSNAMTLLGCVATCEEATGTRDLYVESSKGVNVIGGSWEDAQWAVEIQASQVTWSAYSVESCTDGAFAITGNDSLLKYIGGLIFNPGTVAVFKSSASDAFIDVDTLKLETPSVDPAKVFVMAGASSVAFGKIRADEARFEEGGADFYTVATGTVKSKVNSNIFSNPYSSSAHTTEIQAATTGFGSYLTNLIGNGGYYAKAGNNKTNDGTEAEFEGRDIADELLFRVNSGGLTEIRQPVAGTKILSLKTQATNDDVEEITYQNRVATVDATVTTLHTFILSASVTHAIEAIVIARRTGGAAGTAEDGARYRMSAAFKMVAGVATIIGAATILADEDQPAWDAAFVSSGLADGVLRIRVTGAVDNNITWHMVARTYIVST
jgi:hypothetical protein